MTPLDDLLLLRAFVAIVECEGISAAARALKVPQPTLSRRLRMLEESCGVVLLRRDTHRINLTDAGEKLYEDALEILERVDSASQRLQKDQLEIRGHVRVFATIDSGQFLVTRILARFLREHPGITAELGYTNRLLRMIDEGFDVGIVTGGITDDRVVAVDGGKVARLLVAAPELMRAMLVPSQPSDLGDWPWVVLSGSQFGDARNVELISAALPKEVISITPIFSTEGVTSMREALLEGIGIGVMPDWLVRADLKEGKLVRVLPEWHAPELAVHLIYPAGRQMPWRVRMFLDFASALMKSETWPGAQS